jgi:hypothetical protein
MSESSSDQKSPDWSPSLDAYVVKLIKRVRIYAWIQQRQIEYASGLDDKISLGVRGLSFATGVFTLISNSLVSGEAVLVLNIIAGVGTLGIGALEQWRRSEEAEQQFSQRLKAVRQLEMMSNIWERELALPVSARKNASVFVSAIVDEFNKTLDYTPQPDMMFIAEAEKEFGVADYNDITRRVDANSSDVNFGAGYFPASGNVQVVVQKTNPELSFELGAFKY